MTVDEDSGPPGQSDEPSPGAASFWDLPALAGLLAGRLAGDPLSRGDHWNAPLRFPWLWADVTLQTYTAWARRSIAATGRRSVLTWAYEGPAQAEQGQRHAALRSVGRWVAAGLALLVVLALFAALVAAPYTLLFAVLVLAGAPPADALDAALVLAGLVVLLRVPRLLRGIAALARRVLRRSGTAEVAAAPLQRHGALLLGLAASRIGSGTDALTGWALARSTGVDELRAHVANPRVLDKARARPGAVVSQVDDLPGGSPRWLVVTPVPRAPTRTDETADSREHEGRGEDRD